MNYSGPLYAKFGKKYIKLNETAADFDALKEENIALKNRVEILDKIVSEINDARGDYNEETDDFTESDDFTSEKIADIVMKYIL